MATPDLIIVITRLKGGGSKKTNKGANWAAWKNHIDDTAAAAELEEKEKVVLTFTKLVPQKQLRRGEDGNFV